MEQRVSDIMHRGVVSCTADTPLSQVAILMRDNDISSVVVVSDSGDLKGIVTQSDMVKSLSIRHLERRPWNMLAEHFMTPEVITTHPYTSLDEASQLMTERHIHRLVVVDPAQPTRPVGVCSLTDIIRALADEPEERSAK